MAGKGRGRNISTKEINTEISDLTFEVKDFIKLLYRYYEKKGREVRDVDLVYFREVIAEYKGVLIPIPIISKLLGKIKNGENIAPGGETNLVSTKQIEKHNADMIRLVTLRRQLDIADMDNFYAKSLEKRESMEIEHVKRIKNLYDKELETRLKIATSSFSNEDLSKGSLRYFERQRTLEDKPKAIFRLDGVEDKELLKELQNREAFDDKIIQIEKENAESQEIAPKKRGRPKKIKSAIE